MTPDQIYNRLTPHMLKQYDRAVKGGYKGCFKTPTTELTRIIHFLRYHRWWSFKRITQKIEVFESDLRKYDKPGDCLKYN